MKKIRRRDWEWNFIGTLLHIYAPRLNLEQGIMYSFCKKCKLKIEACKKNVALKAGCFITVSYYITYLPQPLATKFAA